MKEAIKTLTLFIVFCIGHNYSYAQIKSADTLVVRLFNSLKSKDVQLYLSLYPNRDQQLNISSRMLLKQKKLLDEFQKLERSLSDSGKQLSSDSLYHEQLKAISNPETFKSAELNFVKSLLPAAHQGEELRIDWANAQIKHIKIDSTALNDSFSLEILGSGFKMFSAIVDFNSNNDSFQLLINKAFYYPEEKGWFGGEFRQVIRTGEKFSKDLVEDDGRPQLKIEKITVSAINNDVPPPPPPPLKPRSKRKVRH